MAGYLAPSTAKPLRRWHDAQAPTSNRVHLAGLQPVGSQTQLLRCFNTICSANGPAHNASIPLTNILQAAKAQQHVVAVEHVKSAAARTAAPSNATQPPLAPSKEEKHKQCLFKKFGGIMHDPTRLYQHDIVLSLCTNPAVPRAARQRYEALQPARLQELIRRRVGIEKELKALQQTAELHYRQVHKWHNLTAIEGGTMGDIDATVEMQKVLSHKSRIGQALVKLEKEHMIGSAMQDSDYMQYTEPITQQFQALDAFYDAYRKRYVPYVLAVSSLNRKLARHTDASNPSRSSSTAAKAAEQLQALGDCIPQPPQTLDPYLLRYPPPNYTIPLSIQQLKQRKFEQQARQHVERPLPQRRLKASPVSPPVLQDIRQPELFVHPTMFD